MDQNNCLEKCNSGCEAEHETTTADENQTSCTEKSKENETTCIEKNNEDCTDKSPSNPTDFSNLVESGQNGCMVRCRDCGSLVLSRRSASYLKESHPLPTPTQPRHAPSPTTHDVDEWWTVEDMFTFDNIGFSHTVGSIKYLVCADCERGPLGWHDTTSQRSYVALSRVNNII